MKTNGSDDFIASLRTTELHSLARIFSRNLLRAENLRYMHLHLVYPRILERRQMEIMTQIIRERAVERVIDSDSFTPEFEEEVRKRLVLEGDASLVDYLAHGAREYIDRLATQDPEFGVWLRALEHSATMALWSAFESLVSDVWTYAVNSKPQLFAERAMRQFNESLQRHGLSSRSIPVGLAARYNFDLRNHIGDIVADSIDFTSLSDIKKAYTAAFGLGTEGQNLLESEPLRNLVLMRNLIAHRSGVVDVEFKEKTAIPGNVGEELAVPNGMATQLTTAVRDCGMHLLKLVDDCLAAEQPGPERQALPTAPE